MADVSPSSPSNPFPRAGIMSTHGTLQTQQSNEVGVRTSESPRPESLDVANVIPASAVTVVAQESAEERRHRLKEAAKEANEKRLQGRLTMAIMGVTYLSLFALVAYMAIGGTPEQQKWGLDGLKILFGGVGGILIGRRIAGAQRPDSDHVEEQDGASLRLGAGPVVSIHPQLFFDSSGVVRKRALPHFVWITQRAARGDVAARNWLARTSGA